MTPLFPTWFEPLLATAITIVGALGIVRDRRRERAR